MILGYFVVIFTEVSREVIVIRLEGCYLLRHLEIIVQAACTCDL
jgi:hypothetical protein